MSEEESTNIEDSELEDNEPQSDEDIDEILG